MEENNISYAGYPVTSEGYTVLQEIGTGAFATVYRGVVKGTGEEVAIKVIDLDLFNTNWDEIKREISTMSLLNHANITKINCSFVDHQNLWIVMPLLGIGSCAHIMKTIAPTGFKDDSLIATILKETLNGLAYLHKDGKIHRDVKASNILIGSQGEVQLADFGVTGTFRDNGGRKKNRQTFTGTPCWMAPEVMEQVDGYTEKVDIWSFGILCMELGYGYAPYAKFQPMKVMLLTLQEDPPTCDIYDDFSYTFSKHYYSLISKCLRKDPNKRPSAKKLLEHKFFRLAKDRQYVMEKIERRMPIVEPPMEPIAVVQKKSSLHPDEQSTSGGDGVAVGSWVFDPVDIVELKHSIIQDVHELNRPQIIDEDDESDFNTPFGSPPISPRPALNTSITITSSTSITSGESVSNQSRFIVDDIVDNMGLSLPATSSISIPKAKVSKDAPDNYLMANLSSTPPLSSINGGNGLLSSRQFGSLTSNALASIPITNLSSTSSSIHSYTMPSASASQLTSLPASFVLPTISPPVISLSSSVPTKSTSILQPSLENNTSTPIITQSQVGRFSVLDHEDGH